MGQSDLATFRRELDEFSSRLDQRIREFRERGRFSDLDQEFLTKAQNRVDRLRTRVAEAEKHGTPLDLLKAEAERDFTALAEDVEMLARQSSAEFMKHRASNESKGRWQ